jgi:hypothetical protein
VSFPAFAQRVTVLGSTLNMVATSAGVSNGSASGVRADMLTASPPGPVLRSLRFLLFVALVESLPRMSYIVRSDHIAITSGDKSTTGSKVSVRVAPHVPRCALSRCVILATRIVAQRADSEKSSASPIGYLARLPTLPAGPAPLILRTLPF